MSALLVYLCSRDSNTQLTSQAHCKAKVIDWFLKVVFEN